MCRSLPPRSISTIMIGPAQSSVMSESSCQLELEVTVMSATPSGNAVTVTTGVPLALASGNLKVTGNYENEDRAGPRSSSPETYNLSHGDLKHDPHCAGAGLSNVATPSLGGVRVDLSRSLQ